MPAHTGTHPPCSSSSSTTTTTTTTTTTITGSDGGGGGGDGDDGGDGSGLVSDPSFPDRIVEPVLQAVMDGDLAALRTALDGKAIDPDVRPYLMCS